MNQIYSFDLGCATCLRKAAEYSVASIAWLGHKLVVLCKTLSPKWADWLTSFILNSPAAPQKMQLPVRKFSMKLEKLPKVILLHIAEFVMPHENYLISKERNLFFLSKEIYALSLEEEFLKHKETIVNDILCKALSQRTAEGDIQKCKPSLRKMAAKVGPTIHKLDFDELSDRFTQVQLKRLEKYFPKAIFSNFEMKLSKRAKNDDLKKIVTKWPNIRSLKLENCCLITDAAFKWIVKLEKLQTLELSGCKKITDKGIRTLVEAHSLEYLEVWNCRKLSAQAFDYLESKNEALTIDRDENEEAFVPPPQVQQPLLAPYAQENEELFPAENNEDELPVIHPLRQTFYPLHHPLHPLHPLDLYFFPKRF